MTQDIRREPRQDEQFDGTVEVPIGTLLTLCRWADNEAMPMGHWLQPRFVGDAVHEAYEILDIPLRRKDVAVDAAGRLQQRADTLSIDVMEGDDSPRIEVTSHNSVFDLEERVITERVNEGDHRFQVTFVDDITTELLLDDD